MCSAFVTQLNREIAAGAKQAELSRTGLQQRFIAWFDSVPEISRVRPYSMAELEMALKTQGRYLSPILLRFGWKRRRKWSSQGQYHRYWTPPHDL